MFCVDSSGAAARAFNTLASVCASGVPPAPLALCATAPNPGTSARVSPPSRIALPFTRPRLLIVIPEELLVSSLPPCIGGEANLDFCQRRGFREKVPALPSRDPVFTPRSRRPTDPEMQSRKTPGMFAQPNPSKFLTPSHCGKRERTEKPKTGKRLVPRLSYSPNITAIRPYQIDSTA